MLSRAAKYLFPIGGTALLMPNTVFAAGSKPGCVYDDPPKKEGGEGKGAAAKPEAECELERVVMKCRQELAPIIKETSTYTASASEVGKEYYKKLMENICYLRTKAPQEVRLGTIAAGGLFGMMLGVRRGLTRKLFLGGLGAAGASYVVYPKETVYYARNSYSIAKKNAAIAYNFVMGGNQNNGESSCRYDNPSAKSRK